MRVLRTIVVASAVCASGLTLRAQTPDSKLADGIQAIVHDSVVSYQDVEISVAPAMEVLRGEHLTDRAGYEKRVSEVLRDGLNQLIGRQLILHEFTTAGYNIPESIIDEETQKYIRDHYRDRATFTRTLQAEGTTYEKFRRQMRDRIIIEALQARNISSAIMISPHKIETYYQSHTNDLNFKLADQVKLRMIQLNKTSADDKAARLLGEEVLAKIKEGATFSEMAAVYSQGQQRIQGGDMGWIERPDLRKELAEAAFTLKPGEPSSVIELPEVCYLMLVEEKRAAHVKALGEVRDEIETALLKEERNRLQRQWIERLKKKTFIRFF